MTLAVLNSSGGVIETFLHSIHEFESAYISRDQSLTFILEVAWLSLSLNTKSGLCPWYYFMSFKTGPAIQAVILQSLTFPETKFRKASGNEPCHILGIGEQTQLPNHPACDCKQALARPERVH